MEREICGRKVVSDCELLKRTPADGSLRVDLGIVGTPGGATEPKEPPLPRFWDLALKDKGELSRLRAEPPFDWRCFAKSLPAIRFHASRTKTKIWDIWRAAMPQALLAKKAREVHTTAVLCTFETYQCPSPLMNLSSTSVGEMEPSLQNEASP